MEQLGKANEAQKPRIRQVFYLSKENKEIYPTMEKGIGVVSRIMSRAMDDKRSDQVLVRIDLI